MKNQKDESMELNGESGGGVVKDFGGRVGPCELRALLLGHALEYNCHALEYNPHVPEYNLHVPESNCHAPEYNPRCTGI